MVIQWCNNGLTMVNNGMIWDLSSGDYTIENAPLEFVDLPIQNAVP